MKTMTVAELSRREARCRRMGYIWSARGYLACLRGARQAGTSNDPVEDGLGATQELHYRALILHYRTLARGILSVWP